MRLLLSATALAAALAASTAAELSDKASAAAATVLNPFPSLRKKGDAVYTTVHQYVVNKTDELAPVKAAASDKEHAISAAIHDAAGPLGDETMEAWISISNALWAARNKTGPGECKPGAGKLKAGLSAKGEPLSFAFQGSGTLLPYYFGAVGGLQDAGVMTPEVAASAHFGALSGGSITSMFTAAGFTGPEMLLILRAAYAALGECLTDGSRGPNDPRCALYNVAAPIFIDALKEKNPNAARDVSGRLTIWTCQVNTLSTDNKHSISLGTSKWDSIEDLVHNVVASGSIPCFSIPTQYTNFRGIGMIDGGYCNDFAQLCPKTPSKCVKLSTTFLGPDLRGTEYPTADNCQYVVPSDYLPYPDKPYYTPDPSAWTPREAAWPSTSAFCQDPASPVSAPFVAQGVTAKPDIYPFFYEPLPADFSSGCDWLSLGLKALESFPKLQAIYDVGYAAAQGWAKEQGYC